MSTLLTPPMHGLTDSQQRLDESFKRLEVAHRKAHPSHTPMHGHHRNISLTPPESPEGFSTASSQSRRSSTFSASSSLSSVLSASHPSADPECDPCPKIQFASQATLPSEDKAGCNIWTMPPTVALTLLSRSVELIVSITPDDQASPPAAPIRPSAAFPNISKIPSWVNPSPGYRSPSPNVSPASDQTSSPAAGNSRYAFGSTEVGDIDGVTVKKRSPSPSDAMTSPVPMHVGSPEESAYSKVVGEGIESTDNMTQYSTITRKFWSKTAPPISVEDYLFRIHRYCPLSTAVYLGASLYLHRLSLLDRILPITPRSVHRILIAALRVSAKALEDCTHSQDLFAKVGGLSKTELAKLEVSFCFLNGFDFKVTEEMLEQQAYVLRQQVETQAMIGRAGLMGRRITGRNEDESYLSSRDRSRSRSRAKSPRPRKVMLDV